MNIFEQLFNEILLEGALWQSTTSEEDGEFDHHLHNMYEFEYKLNAIKEWKFNGVPERYKNILENLQEQLAQSTLYVKSSLIQTYQDWLRNHAILEPKEWAIQRLKTYGEDLSYKDIMHNIVSSFWELRKQLGYYNDQLFINKENSYFKEMIDEVFNNLNDFPYFKQYLENTILPAQKEWYYDDFKEDPKEFKERHNLKTDEEVKKYIDSLTIENIDVESIFYYESPNEFIDSLEEVGNTEEILIELFEKVIFPLWFEVWKPQGIEDARERIENIYKQLQTANESNLGNLVTVTSIALNASHQTGSMLDYVQEITGSSDLKEYLNGFTNGIYIKKWDKELKEHGFYPSKKTFSQPKIQKLIQ